MAYCFLLCMCSRPTLFHGGRTKILPPLVAAILAACDVVVRTEDALVAAYQHVRNVPIHNSYQGIVFLSYHTTKYAHFLKLPLHF